MKTKKKAAAKKAAKKAPATKAAKKAAKKVARSAPAPLKHWEIRKEKNGVRAPIPGTQSARLWEICDGLKSSLGRAPARFEFRAELTRLAGLKSAETFNPDSASVQFAQWRKFHGIPGRASGLYPKKNSLEVSTNAADRAPKGTKPGPKPGAKKAATKQAKAPAKKAAKAVKPAAKKAAKKAPAAAKKAAKPAPKASGARGGKGSGNAAKGKASKPAKKAARPSSVPAGGVVVIPEPPAGES